MNNQHPGIVLALGSGGARGVAHVGVLEILERENIPIKAVVGSSIGAEIGALLAAGMSVHEMHHLAQDIDWKTTLRLFMPEFAKGGVIADKGIRTFLEPFLAHKNIEDLDMGYAAIATDLVKADEVVFDSGNLLEAVRASISIPGLLSPAVHQQRVLADGGLVNPVPFDIARQRFGGPVVAVAVHPGANPMDNFATDDWRDRLEDALKDSMLKRFPQLKPWMRLWDDKEEPAALPNWGVGEIYSRAMDVSRAQLMRLREQICAPDVYIKPSIEHIGMLEFYRSDEAIAAGRHATESMIQQIKALR